MSDKKKKKIKRNVVERYIDKKVDEWVKKSEIKERKRKNRKRYSGVHGEPVHKSNVAQSEGKLGKTVDWDFGKYEKGDDVMHKDTVPTKKYPTKSQKKRRKTATKHLAKKRKGGTVTRKAAGGLIGVAAKVAKSKKLTDLIKKGVIKSGTKLKDLRKLMTKEKGKKKVFSPTTHLKNVAKGLTAKKRKGGTIKRKPAKKYRAGGAVRRGVGIAKRGW
jgi:hypothetical protein